MKLEKFCIALHSLTLSQAQKAVALLWFHDREEPGIRLKAGELTRVIRDFGLGNPNSTQLGQAIKKTKLVHSSAGGFQIKPTAKGTVEGWVESIIGPQKPDVDQNMDIFLNLFGLILVFILKGLLKRSMGVINVASIMGRVFC